MKAAKETPYTLLKQIEQKETNVKFFNKLFELLQERPNSAAPLLKQLSADIAIGDIRTLEELGERFDEVADSEYREALNLLSQYNQATVLEK